ncbi:transcriptional regulator [Amycolatopsis antarctica]|uniref:Transcriptional regulator n=1 Tax=Amycolatopsis antarctica TaxID=1854586 RepID=A0A263D020_9PSEU|nr:helix-turn-helix transcriptional regulator [Amycolatopsis antarctica]OZM71478.1 transcriptional regulator [Amycolatopsis antarctica]
MTTGGAEHGSGPTARRMVLGSQLRRLREAAGISRSAAGYSIRSSESKISRLELGRVGFKERDVNDLLTMYGIEDGVDRAQFMELVSQSNQPGWWHRYTDLMPNWFHDYVGLEEAAGRIQTFELQVVPGLLQIEEYARAIVSHGNSRVFDEEVDRRVSLRMRRQKLLSGPDAPRFWAVVDQSVLHREVGGPAVLKKQIAHLLEVTASPHITLQVLPYTSSGCAAESPFTMLRFAETELPDIVYVEHLGGALYLDNKKDQELYGRALDRLAVDAETPDRSRQLLSKLYNEV